MYRIPSFFFMLLLLVVGCSGDKTPASEPALSDSGAIRRDTSPRPNSPINEEKTREVRTSPTTPFASVNKSQKELVKLFGPMCDYPFPPPGTCQSLCRQLEGNTANERLHCLRYCILVSRVSTKSAVARFKSFKDIPPTLNLREAIAWVNKSRVKDDGRKRTVQVVCDEIGANDERCGRDRKKGPLWKGFPLECDELLAVVRQDVLNQINGCLLGDCHDYTMCMTNAVCGLY